MKIVDNTIGTKTSSASNPLNTNASLLRKFEESTRRAAETIGDAARYAESDEDVERLLKTLNESLDRRCGAYYYLVSTRELLNEYTELLKNPARWDGKKCDVTAKKAKISADYADLANRVVRDNRWYDVRVADDAVDGSDISSTTRCEVCGNVDVTRFDVDASGRKTCVGCSSDVPTLEIGNTHSDYNRATVVGKFIYNRVVHFQDCIKQFQGKQNCKIPSGVYEALDEKFRAYKLLEDSPNPHVKYSRITRQHITMFLKELRLVKHYENVNAIYFNLTTDLVDDIGHLESKLVDDFKVLVNMYDSLHSKDKSEELDRKNFLNVQYLLFQLLRRHGYACRLEDFSVLKTTDRKLFHDRICCNLFQKLGWNFTPTF